MPEKFVEENQKYFEKFALKKLLIKCQNNGRKRLSQESIKINFTSI
jgi:hypothetical protein